MPCKELFEKNKTRIGCVVNVSTAALIESTYAQMKKVTESEGIQLSEQEFHCRGQFTALHKGHPDAEDFNQAAIFARQLKESFYG